MNCFTIALKVSIASLAAASTFTYGLHSPAGASAAPARQVAVDPALAQDGRGLFNEAPQTRAAFTAVWGDRAAVEWIHEHDAVLSGGNLPNGPRIGFLYAGTASANPLFTQGLVSGLERVGYRPGRNMTIIWRFADGHPENLPALAADLVDQHPDIIVGAVIAESLALQHATNTVPIVTMTVGDPVGVGLANTLERPGGNITGVIQQPISFNAERLRLMKEVVPNATRIAVLANVPTTDDPVLVALREAALPLGLDLHLLPVRTAEELPYAFAAASDGATQAMMILAGTLFTANRAQVIQRATDSGLPAMYPSRLFVDDGGLMDYAYVEAERGLRAAEYVFDILHGANPADMPMEPPPHIELVVNLSAAEAIGWSVPAALLSQATDVLP